MVKTPALSYRIPRHCTRNQHTRQQPNTPQPATLQDLIGCLNCSSFFFPFCRLFFSHLNWVPFLVPFFSTYIPIYFLCFSFFSLSLLRFPFFSPFFYIFFGFVFLFRFLFFPFVIKQLLQLRPCFFPIFVLFFSVLQFRFHFFSFISQFGFHYFLNFVSIIFLFCILIYFQFPFLFFLISFLIISYFFYFL